MGCSLTNVKITSSMNISELFKTNDVTNNLKNVDLKEFSYLNERI